MFPDVVALFEADLCGEYKKFQEQEEKQHDRTAEAAAVCGEVREKSWQSEDGMQTHDEMQVVRGKV